MDHTEKVAEIQKKGRVLREASVSYIILTLYAQNKQLLLISFPPLDKG